MLLEYDTYETDKVKISNPNSNASSENGHQHQDRRNPPQEFDSFDVNNIGFGISTTNLNVTDTIPGTDSNFGDLRHPPSEVQFHRKNLPS